MAGRPLLIMLLYGSGVPRIKSVARAQSLDAILVASLLAVVSVDALCVLVAAVSWLEIHFTVSVHSKRVWSHVASFNEEHCPVVVIGLGWVLIESHCVCVYIARSLRAAAEVVQ